MKLFLHIYCFYFRKNNCYQWFLLIYSVKEKYIWTRIGVTEDNMLPNKSTWSRECFIVKIVKLWRNGYDSTNKRIIVNSLLLIMFRGYDKTTKLGIQLIFVTISIGVIEWLLFNANSAIFQIYHGEDELVCNDMMMRSALY